MKTSVTICDLAAYFLQNPARPCSEIEADARAQWPAAIDLQIERAIEQAVRVARAEAATLLKPADAFEAYVERAQAARRTF